MAYENEINFNKVSIDIQSDLLQNSKDITATELFSDTDGVRVPVIKNIDGIPTIGRIEISTLTSGISEAVERATTTAEEAQLAAENAQTASTAAVSAAQEATGSALACQVAITNFQAILDDYFSTTDQQVKSRLIELGQMAQSGEMEVTVDSIQLFDDFKLATGYTGSYNDFLILLGQGGGGGGSVTVDTEMSSTSTNPVQNKVISTALVGKQDVLEFLNILDIDEILT